MRRSGCFSALMLVSSMALAEGSSYMDEADFIEFMGSWESSDGDWLPPDEVVKLSMPKAEQDEHAEQTEADTDE